MKTSTTKKSTTSNSHSSKPFFNKSREGAFFSQSQEVKTPFFSPLTIQPKLTMGQPGDKYEREADSMADKVVSQISPSPSYSPSPIQTKCNTCEEDEKLQKMEEEKNEGTVMRKAIFESGGDEGPEEMIQSKCEACSKKAQIENPNVEKLQLKEVEEDDDTHDRQVASSIEPRLNSSKGGGSSLSENTRTDMESAFDSDFSGVKVHTGQQAVQMNQELGAKAFTHGGDIYFNSNQYSPNSNSGQKLLAHELTHVVQQSGGKLQRKIQTSKNKNTDKATIKDHIQMVGTVTALNAPAEMPAAQGRRISLRATAPGGTRFDWSVQGANTVGAVLGASTRRTNTLTAPAGSTGGTITIRAADTAAPLVNFEDVTITLVEVQQPTFALSGGVPAVIFPGGAVFPPNTIEASVCGNNATAAAVTVPALRPVTWSIVGRNRGATIDPATGVITPSVTETGDIRVRATDNALNRARNERILTIRAHPERINRTIRTGTTAAAGAGAYGSVYDHIFKTSRGSLNGVNVSEQVFNASDPFATGFAPVLPGLPNIWNLNPAGRMVGDFMLTRAGNPGIDVNRFLPSPPNAGLPQVWTTPQILYWRNEQCNQWIPFANVPIRFILRRRGGAFETVTINNGVAAPPEAYTGPALAAGAAPVGAACAAGTNVSRVRFAPSTIAADGNALTTTAATARVSPGGSGITWTFPGQNFGAAITAQGNPALISAGNVASQVRVRAALTATPACFAEGWLRMREVEIRPIQFSPRTVRTGRTTRARVSTLPDSRTVNWTIQTPAAAQLGAVIATNPDNSATITAGAQIGRITIRATDQRDGTVFTESSLVIR